MRPRLGTRSGHLQGTGARTFLAVVLRESPQHLNELNTPHLHQLSHTVPHNKSAAMDDDQPSAVPATAAKSNAHFHPRFTEGDIIVTSNDDVKFRFSHDLLSEHPPV